MTVRLYGSRDHIAIATGLLDRKIRLPDGSRLDGPWDFRKIWVESEDGWQLSPDMELPELAPLQ